MQDDQVDTASSPAALATVDVEPEPATLPTPVPTSVAPSSPDRALHSDPHDFAGLYIRHRSSFTLHARRYLHDARDADEVVQEAFLRLFLALPELETELQALAYCRRTITNLCIDRYRAQARRPRLVDLDSVPAEDLADDDTGDPVVRAEDAAVVRDALSMLSPLHRAALVKREIEEKPLPVIAGELEIPEDSVKHVLFRARRALRRLLTATSVAPGADDEAGLGLARAGSGGLAALILLVALGLGSGPNLTAIPVVGDDLPDMPGVTELARAVGHAVEDVSRAVTSSVGAPQGLGGSAGRPAGQGAGDPVPLSAGDASPTLAPAEPQVGSAALRPSPAGSPAPAVTSWPLLAPVQGDVEQPGTETDTEGGTGSDPGTEGVGTDPEAEPSDAATETAEPAPAPAATPRRWWPGSVDRMWPGPGPVATEVPGAVTGRPSPSSAEPAASPLPSTSPAGPTSPDTQTPPAPKEAAAEPRVVSPRSDAVERLSQASAGPRRSGAVSQPGGRAPVAASGEARRVVQRDAEAKPDRQAKPTPQATPARQAKPPKAATSVTPVRPAPPAKAGKPAKQGHPEKPATVSALVHGSTEGTAGATGTPAPGTGAPDAASSGQPPGTLVQRLLGTPVAPAS